MSATTDAVETTEGNMAPPRLVKKAPSSSEPTPGLTELVVATNAPAVVPVEKPKRVRKPAEKKKPKKKEEKTKSKKRPREDSSSSSSEESSGEEEARRKRQKHSHHTKHVETPDIAQLIENEREHLKQMAKVCMQLFDDKPTVHNAICNQFFHYVMGSGQLLDKELCMFLPQKKSTLFLE
jgi:transposase